MDKDKRKAVFKAVKQIAESRQGHAMSQTELGEYFDIHPSKISSIASGKKAPSLNEALKIAQKIGVSLDYIYGLSDSVYREDTYVFQKAIQDAKYQLSIKLELLETIMNRDINKLKEYINGLL